MTVYVLNSHGLKTTKKLKLSGDQLVITPSPIVKSYTTAVADRSVLEKAIHNGKLLKSEPNNAWSVYGQDSEELTDINLSTGEGFDDIINFAKYGGTHPEWHSIVSDGYTDKDWGYFDYDDKATLSVRRDGAIISIQGQEIKKYLNQVKENFIIDANKQLVLKDAKIDNNLLAKARDCPIFCCFPKVHKIKVFASTCLEEVFSETAKIHEGEEVSIVVAACNASMGGGHPDPSVIVAGDSELTLNNLITDYKKTAAIAKKEKDKESTDKLQKELILAQENVIGSIGTYNDDLYSINVKDDGNCFYYAIAAALNIEDRCIPAKHTNDSLRQIVIQNIDKLDRDLLCQELVSNKKESLGSEIESLRSVIKNNSPNLGVVLSVDDLRLIENNIKQLTAEIDKLNNNDQDTINNLVATYIASVKSGKAWGGDAASIGILAKQLNRKIIIISKEQDPGTGQPKSFWSHGDANDKPPIFLQFDGFDANTGNKHYEALFVKAGLDGHQVLAKIQAIHAAKVQGKQKKSEQDKLASTLKPPTPKPPTVKTQASKDLVTLNKFVEYFDKLNNLKNDIIYVSEADNLKKIIGKIVAKKDTKEAKINQVLANVKENSIELPVASNTDNKLLPFQLTIAIERLKFESSTATIQDPAIIEVANFSPQQLEELLNLISKEQPKLFIRLELPASFKDCKYGNGQSYTEKEFNDISKKIIRYNNVNIFDETKTIAEFILESDRPKDSELIAIKETVTAKATDPIDNFEINLLEMDTIAAAAQLFKKYSTKPLVMNMANNISIGGGVEHGALAQEEFIFRCSNYHQSLYKLHGPTNPSLYAEPIPHNAAYYTQDISVLRGENYKLLDESERFKIDAVAIAGYNLRKYNESSSIDKHGSSKEDKELIEAFVKDRDQCNTSQHANCDFLELKQVFTAKTKEKIKLMLQIACEKGNQSIVLGAISSGAFRLQYLDKDPNNPWTLQHNNSWTVNCVAEAYKQAFIDAKKEGLLNNIKNISFALMPDPTNLASQMNIEVFKELIPKLREIITTGAAKDIKYKP